jgi:hypothetical protein
LLAWIAQYTPAERKIRRQQARQQVMVTRPPSQAQLTYFQVLGDAGPPPLMMAETSTRIDTLAHREVGA